MKQKRILAETIAQNVIGQILAFAILWFYGLSLVSPTTWKLQITFTIASYLRSYGLRWYFERSRPGA